MLKTLRNPKNVKRIMFTTLILIIPAFIFLYGWNQLTEPAGENITYASKVNGREISIQTFQREYNRLVEQLRQQYGTEFENNPDIQYQIAAQVIEELENRELVLREANEMGIIVSDEELNMVIQATPAFQSGGQFNSEQYRRMLFSQGMTPEIYEQTIRIERLYRKIFQLVTDFVKISEPEVREQFRKEFERITVDAIRFSALDYINQINITDSEAREYYQNNRTDFQIPPQHNIAYLTLSPNIFISEIQITNEQIQQYYDSAILDFIVPERVHARHILAMLPPNASSQQDQSALTLISQAYSRLENGELFENVARELSQDPSNAPQGGDLGWISRGETVPEFERVAFSVQTGEISDIFRTEFGYHILKIEQKESSRTKNIEEVQNEIIQILQTNIANEKAYAESVNIMNAITAQTQLLELSLPDGFSRGSTGWFFGNQIPGFGENRELASIIFSLTPGRITGPTRTNQGYHIIQLLGRQNSRIPEFEEVNENVRSRLVLERAIDKARTNAQEVEQILRSGQTFEQIAATLGKNIVSIGPFTLGDDIPGIGSRSPLAVTAFHLPDGKTSGVISMDNIPDGQLPKFYIIRINSREGATESVYLEQHDRIAQTVLNGKRQKIFAEWVRNLRARARIQTNINLLERYRME